MPRPAERNPYDLTANLALPRGDEAPPRELFHYTSPEGLLEIVSSNRIWATNLQFMNDPSELRYGVRLFLDLLRRERGAGRYPAVARLLEEADQKVELFYRRIRFYAVSFCDDGGDRLSQWRTYAKEGTGYSIGFRSADLVNSLAREARRRSLQTRLIRVVYNRRQQEALVQAALERIGGYLRKSRAGAGAGRKPDPERLANLFCIHLFPYVLSFKAAGFAEEREWRLVRWLPSESEKKEVKFRTSERFVIPYIELNLADSRLRGKLPITKIVQGPRVEPEAGLSSLDLLAQKYGYGNVDLVASRTPLR
jgi:hypothetical protein